MDRLNGTFTITNNEHRPCIVNGRKAIFHRWSDQEKIFFKIDNNMRLEHAQDLAACFIDAGVFPKCFNTEKIKITVAIVEFEDGMIKEIEPMKVKFLDSGNLFHGICFEEEKTDGE